MRKVKFGVFTDLHVDIMHDTQERLQVFLDTCRQEDVDFIIQLGDFCYPDDNRKVVCKPEHMPVNIANAIQVKTYADKPAILRMFNSFEKPSYHVLGNHDCDMCSKQETLQFLEAKNGSYYSFDHGGFHFVVLDTNYLKTSSGEFIAYENANYFAAGFRKDMVRENVSPDQIAWLKEDLANTKNPTIVFSHASFSLVGAPSFAVKNHKELREIFQNAPAGVVACFNGHHHVDLCAKEEGIWYVQINSMDCIWLDLALSVRTGSDRKLMKSIPILSTRLLIKILFLRLLPWMMTVWKSKAGSRSLWAPPRRNWAFTVKTAGGQKYTDIISTSPLPLRRIVTCHLNNQQNENPSAVWPQKDFLMWMVRAMGHVKV